MTTRAGAEATSKALNVVVIQNPQAFSGTSMAAAAVAVTGALKLVLDEYRSSQQLKATAAQKQLDREANSDLTKCKIAADNELNERQMKSHENMGALNY